MAFGNTCVKNTRLNKRVVVGFRFMDILRNIIWHLIRFIAGELPLLHMYSVPHHCSGEEIEKYTSDNL